MQWKSWGDGQAETVADVYISLTIDRLYGLLDVELFMLMVKSGRYVTIYLYDHRCQNINIAKTNETSSCVSKCLY